MHSFPSRWLASSFASSLSAAATSVAALSLAMLLTPARAHAQGYNFANVADNTGQFSSFGDLSLNASGQVAFGANLDVGGSGIFASNTAGAAPTTVANSTAALTVSFFGVSLNASGQVAFSASPDSPVFVFGIFASNTAGAAPTTVAISGSQFGSVFVRPSLNDSGQVAFFAQLLTSAGGGSGIFAGNTAGAAPTTVASSAGQFSSFSTNPSLNASGQVAFAARLDTGVDGIFASNTAGAAPTTIANTAGRFFFLSDPSLNASGQVAFRADLDAATPSGRLEGGIFASNTAGAAPTTVADTTGPFSNFGFGAPSLNASGQVAFLADLRAGGSGIYTGTTAGGPTTRVIGTGDALLGSTVNNFRFFSQGFNDNGQIAFSYSLADGRQGIAVASAAEVIPEPGTLTLAGLPLAAMAGMAIRRRRSRNG